MAQHDVWFHRLAGLTPKDNDVYFLSIANFRLLLSSYWLIIP